MIQSRGVCGCTPNGAGTDAISEAYYSNPIQLERPDAIDSFNIDGSPPHPPLKFCIAVAGFRPRGPTIDTLLDGGIITPVLHVIGVNDHIVALERAQTLVDVCRNARVEKHEGGAYSFRFLTASYFLLGHFVPSKATWRTFFAQYIGASDHADSISTVASPKPLLTDSGVSTPATLDSRPPSR